FKEFKFVKKDEPNSLAWKTLMFFSRFAIFTLVIAALATPKIETEIVERGNPYVKILVDNSSSMALFDLSFVDDLKKQIGKEVTVESGTIAYEDESPLGDNMIRHLRKNTNLLLITDGNNNKGSSLNDVAVVARTLNASISAINLREVQSDAAIEIIWPEKTIAGIENEFIVTVDKGGNMQDYSVEVYIDDVLVLNEGPRDSYTIYQAFNDGEHKIKAVLKVNDLFSQNNEFYRTIKVVPKPKLLMLSEKESPLRSLLANLYDIAVATSLPDDLELKRYSAIILNDVPAKSLDKEFAKINEYVADGNGLVAVGGYNSFDRGGYKDAKIETMLPVYIAQAGKEEGIINVILLIDISGSTVEAVGTEQILRVSKALAIAIFKQMDFDNRIGVMAFNQKPYVVVQPDFVVNAVEVENKIARLQYGGGTLIGEALYGAMQVLEPLDGSKNIILLSDGRTQQEGISYEAAALAAKKGMKIYTVTVGDNAN
ncbi:MAG: VWA domain-containing protein, partial [Candidatus Woesearchaeota archaeon]